ncbi:MAG: TolC family protein [Bdellovibrionota bacterium]
MRAATFKQQCKFLAIVITATLALFIQDAQAISIDQYIGLAKEKNPLLKSYQYSLESADLKTKAAEIDLAPVLTFGYVSTNDNSRPSQLGTDREAEVYNLGIAKKFFTGTLVKLDAQTGEFHNTGVLIPGFDQYSTGSVGVTIQQSLWKDSFGHGTRTKISRLEKLAQVQKLANELQSRLALYDVESSYWDYSLAQEDYRLKKANLERAQKIDKWTANRVGNGISDRADLMNAKALMALREAQFIAAEEELKSQEAKLRDNLQLADNEPTPQINGDLGTARPYLINLIKMKNVEKIEARMASLEAEARSLIADETVDGLRPDLSVFGNYTTTSYDRDHNQAVSDMTKDDYPKNSVGVNFTWIFESGAKSATRDAARKDALASKLKADKKRSEGKVAWTDLVRKYDVLKSSVSTLEKVANYQRERAKAEQDKLSKGRTVTANVVLAETDAAEAEINLLRTRSSLRKLEASSLFFIDTVSAE